MSNPPPPPGQLRMRERPAFTLIEVLVVVAVIGILIALILPAVQSARESARRAGCANNLKQIGIALHGYAGVEGTLPPDMNAMSYSYAVGILPYIEQASLYNSINFEITALGFPITPEGVPGPTSPANTTLRRMSLSVYLCPSDKPPLAMMLGCSSYAGNRGHGDQTYGMRDGSLSRPPASFAAFRDGTSQTAAVAEWVFGRGEPTILDPNGKVIQASIPDPKRTAFRTPVSPGGHDQLDQFASACNALDPRTTKSASSSKGIEWMVGDYIATLYNHVVIINGKSCSNAGSVPSGAWTAGSRHPGGGHVLMVDGHVRFVRDSIAAGVWRGLGSRNGGESLGGNY